MAKYTKKFTVDKVGKLYLDGYGSWATTNCRLQISAPASTFSLNINVKLDADFEYAPIQLFKESNATLVRDITESGTYSCDFNVCNSVEINVTAFSGTPFQLIVIGV